MPMSFQFTTDTATLCVYDLAALKHRIDDDADWWVYPPSVQINETQSGAAAFIDLGSDGIFSGQLREEPAADPSVRLKLRCPSGRVFIGAAEEATSEGLEPDCTRGGLLLELAPGTYQLSATMLLDRTLELCLIPTTEQPSNLIDSPLRLSPKAA